MKKIVTVNEQRPNYYRGQLLLETDFQAEQAYHAKARRRHNAKVHGAGVVHGFSVTRKSERTISVNAGYALDTSGHEILLGESQEIDLAEFGPNDSLRVSIQYEDDDPTEGDDGLQQSRRPCKAVISVSSFSMESAGLTLARVRLDSQGHVDADGIDDDETPYVKVLTKGSIASTELHEELKQGWLRLPFRPVPLTDWQTDKKGVPPFRIGVTEALSPDPDKADAKDRGAAGTMAIPIPPGATKVTGLRIAGAKNEGEIQLQLITSGWDRFKNVHIKKTLLDLKITTSSPFLETYDIEEKNKKLDDPDYQTLSLKLVGTRRTAISLIAVSFVYYAK